MPQFKWTARYSGADNTLGKANYRLIGTLGGTNELGLDSTDKAGFDDVIVTDTLFLPVNEEVDFEIRSRDVIHSAYFPQFRAQMNAVPGMQTYFHFKPDKTTAEARKDPYVVKYMEETNALRKEQGKETVDFDYVLLCNKICGTSHYNMQLLIYVGTRAEYDAWMKRHQPFMADKMPTAQKTAQK